MNTQQSCPKCGASAAYSTLGEMYQLSCATCGHKEAGMFVPAFLDMPRTQPVEVIIHLNELAPTGKNLFALSKLHPKLEHLRPNELKAHFLSGNAIRLGFLHKMEAEKVQRAAVNTGLLVQCIE